MSDLLQDQTSSYPKLEHAGQVDNGLVAGKIADVQEQEGTNEILEKQASMMRSTDSCCQAIMNLKVAAMNAIFSE